MNKNIITELINELEEIAGVLYKDKIDEGMAMMTNVLPNLSLYVTTLESEEERQQFLDNALAPALEAMESRDAIMLADIITYEIIEVLNQ